MSVKEKEGGGKGGREGGGDVPHGASPHIIGALALLL